MEILIRKISFFLIEEKAQKMKQIHSFFRLWISTIVSSYMYINIQNIAYICFVCKNEHMKNSLELHWSLNYIHLIILNNNFKIRYPNNNTE